MKRSGIVLILAVFLICMVTGFLLTRVLKTQTPGLAQAEPQPPALQQNLVIIHVNNFISDTPRIQSIWIIFLNYANRPSVGFLQLYRADQPDSTLPGKAITLTPEKHLSDTFIQTLASTYKVRLDGYILLDDQAMITFANIFPKSPELANTAFPSGEHEILANICRYFITLQPGGVINIPWMEFLPNHFSTDIPFDIFLKNWGSLNNPANPPNCEIITRSK